jgi:Flp pilus assembly protein TadG
MVNFITAARQRLHQFRLARSGAAALEFALVVPLLSAMLFGIVKFGIAYNHRLALTDATRAGVRELAVGRQSPSVYTDTVSTFRGSALALSAGSTTLQLFVNGAQCTSDSSCEAALATSEGVPARLVASYPCDVEVFGVDFAPGCTLSADSTQRVE